MAEFTLPANSKIDKSAGKTYKAPAGAKSVRTLRHLSLRSGFRRQSAHGHL